MRKTRINSAIIEQCPDSESDNDIRMILTVKKNQSRLPRPSLVCKQPFIIAIEIAHV